MAIDRDAASRRQWCEDFIVSYVERYLPQLGITAAPFLLRRLCSMVAHQQGATLNLSRMAGSLGIDGKTVRHYLDLLEGLYLVRSIPAWSRNAGKRLVKSPKVYWRDSGLLHSLAGIDDLEHLLGHPLCGHSWEGYCLEQIIPCCLKAPISPITALKLEQKSIWFSKLRRVRSSPSRSNARYLRSSAPLFLKAPRHCRPLGATFSRPAEIPTL